MQNKYSIVLFTIETTTIIVVKKDRNGKTLRREQDKSCVTWPIEEPLFTFLV